MPFKSEKQRRYLWANEPEIARDWTNTYGSRIQKNTGGIMRIPFRTAGAVAAAHGKAAASPGAVDRGGNNREKGIMSRGLGPQGTTGTIGNFQNQGPDRSAVGQFSTYGRNVMNQNLTGGSVGFNPLNALLTYINPALSFAVKGFNTLGNQFSSSWKDWRESDNFQQFLNRRQTGTTITNPAVLGNYLPSNINYTFNTDRYDLNPEFNDLIPLAKVTKQDLAKYSPRHQKKSIDASTYETAIDTGLINPEMTEFEFNKLKEGLITEPGTYTEEDFA